MAKRPKVYGLLAEYETPRELYHACEKVRDAGYGAWDAHTPFPVHGLEKAMGLRPSIIPWIVCVMGFTGAGLGFLLQLFQLGRGQQLQAQGQLLDQLAAHFLAQLAGLLAGADQVVLVVHVDALHFQLVLQQQQVLLAADLVVQAGGQLELGTACAAAAAGGTLGFLLVGQEQDRKSVV